MRRRCRLISVGPVGQSDIRGPPPMPWLLTSLGRYWCILRLMVHLAAVTTSSGAILPLISIFNVWKNLGRKGMI
ncbi:hypothetical protein CRG98_034470 [Punica granatum]|uniref:Uncharacterized protein n=1 Tax=Punica granatum TaxID=22663 RepID=A0A2I0INV1_PUNGR|nr:hypothetical protein CRG98_034470 [Punica granatum]